jgi:hypothetical protein
LINAVLAVAKTNADAGCDLDLGTDCDLKLRLRFFDSVLYTDFQEQRVGGLLKAAKLALERPKRDQLLEALDSVKDTSSDENVKKQVCWARTLFSTTLSERERLMFALSDEGAINFALTWPQLKGDPNWESISALSAPCARWPDSVTAAAFIALVNDIVTCKTKKLIKNPVVSLLVDFIIATRTALGKHDWVEEMITAAADHRLEARWGTDFDQSKICEEHVTKAVSLLEKVFISSEPPWLRTLKDRAEAKLAEDKDKKRNAIDAVAAAPKKKALPCAGPAPCAGEAPLGDDPASVNVQEDTGTAERADIACEGRPWYVGDIVTLKTKLKKYGGFQAQVVNVLAQRLDVLMSAGPMEGQTYRCAKETAVLVTKSTLDPTFTSQPEEEVVVNESKKDAEDEIETKPSDAALAVDIFGTDFEQDAV